MNHVCFIGIYNDLIFRLSSLYLLVNPKLKNLRVPFYAEFLYKKNSSSLNFIMVNLPSAVFYPTVIFGKPSSLNNIMGHLISLCAFIIDVRFFLRESYI